MVNWFQNAPSSPAGSRIIMNAAIFTQNLTGQRQDRSLLGTDAGIGICPPHQRERGNAEGRLIVRTGWHLER